jgi:hypothetical protein
VRNAKLSKNFLSMRGERVAKAAQAASATSEKRTALVVMAMTRTVDSEEEQEMLRRTNWRVWMVRWMGTKIRARQHFGLRSQ